MNVFVVIPVYVIISSSILSRPYFCGNPLVLVTVIIPTLTSVPIPVLRLTLSTTTSGVRLSNFKY